MPPGRTLLGLLELGEDTVDGVGRHARSGVAHGEAEHGFAPVRAAPGASVERQTDAARLP